MGEVSRVHNAVRIDHSAFAVRFACLEPTLVNQSASAIDRDSPALHDLSIFQPLTFVDFSTVKDSDLPLFELAQYRFID